MLGFLHFSLSDGKRWGFSVISQNIADLSFPLFRFAPLAIPLDRKH